MMQKLFKLPQIVRYLIVAVAAYAVDMGGYIALLHLGFTPIVANALVKIAAATFGFFAHRYYTYQIKNNHNMGSHAVKYFGMVAAYTPISSLFLKGMLMVINHSVIAKGICDVILFVAVYWLTSKFTFLQSDVAEPSAVSKNNSQTDTVTTHKDAQTP